MATPRSNAKKTLQDMKAALRFLFEEEYYSKQFGLQKCIPNEEDFGLYVPLRTTQKKDGGSEAIDLQQKILENISSPVGPLSTLVLGDSGTGKSWLALKLTKHLYDSSQEQFQNKIPLYIPLGKIESMIKEVPSSSKTDILYSYIKFYTDSLGLDSDFKFENFYKKLCKAELILILDGFDELEVKVNLWETNEWTSDKFSDRLCTIVFCRPSALLAIDFSEMFGFYKNRDKHIPDRYNISLLDKNLVENYVRQVPQFLSKIRYDENYESQNMRDPTWMMTKSVTSKHCKWESNGEDSEYEDWFFVKLPELQRLARNIYILKIICQLLPKLVEDERIRTGQNKTTDEFMDKLEEICRTEVLLYDKFTEAWFTYQVDKFKLKACEIQNVEETFAKYVSDIKSVLVHYMVGYAQNLAMRHARLKAGRISNGEILASETLYWNLWTPWSPNSETFSRDRKLEDELFPNNENDTDEHRAANLQYLRDSCLLRCSSDNRSFSFIHLSLFEYFLSREVFEKFRGALNYYSNWERRLANDLYFPINQRNINDSEFIGILSNLVGRAKVDENFQTLLLETVKKSATLPGIEQMASNALTILNLSGFSFSGKMTEDDNFQNIQVPGTNFQNSICGNSDFSGANLKGSKFRQGWFQGCKFQGVNFSECSFGQIAPISLASKTCRVLDILCYAADEFYYVVVCYYELCRTEKEIDLYIRNYKLTIDFEEQDCELICLQQQMEYKYFFQYFLTKGSGSGTVFLFIFSDTKIQLGEAHINTKVPKYWYEFNFNSKLASNETNLPAFDRDSFLSFMNSSKYVQKFIVFYSGNRNPEFCGKERFNLEAASRQFPEKTKLYCNKYFWMPFGNLKLLVFVGHEGLRDFTDANILDDIKNVTLLHTGKPIVSLQESSCFEIFWQTVQSSSSGTPKDILYLQEVLEYNYGSCYNGYSLLCLSVDGANKYFFDLLSHTLVDVFETPGYSSKYQLLLKSPTQQIIYSDLQVVSFKEHKFQWKLDSVVRPVVYRISENMDFVVKLRDALIEVFNVETGMLCQNVVKDANTPATFLSTKHGTAINSYLLYFYQRSLHFEKLEPIWDSTKEIVVPKAYPTRKYFSDDGLLCVHVREDRSSFSLEFYFSKDNDKYRKYFVRRFEIDMNFFPIDHAVLITKNKLVIFYHYIQSLDTKKEGFKKSSGFDEHFLIAYDAQSRLQVQIDGIPYEKMSSRKYVTHISPIQTCQKLIVDYDHELNIYDVEEFPLVGKMSLQLLYSFPFRGVIGRPLVVFDPNFENLVYIFSKKIHNKNFQFLDLNKNSGEELTINCSERSDNTATKTKNLSTVLFKDKIMVGYRDSSTFYTVRAMPYNESGVENPVHVVPSTKLGWIVSQFPNGDLHITESIQLKTLLVLDGFHPGCKLHIVDQNSKQVRIILFDLSPHLAFITINADSLREYFEKGGLEKFKDWKVGRSVASSILSLTEVDISYSKYLNKSDKSLFEFHSSVGYSAEDEYYRPFCNLFLPVTNYAHSILKVDNAQPCDLSQFWTVTIIAKKQKIKLFKKTMYTATNRHSALVVEGIMHGGHFIIRAELTRPSKDIVQIECQSYRGKVNYEEIIHKYYGKQIQVDPAKGLKLLKNIWVDTYNPQWKYDLRFHNCNTWIKKKLEILGFGNEFDSKAYRFFLSLPQDFNLEKFKI